METGLLDQLNPFMALISGRNQLADAIFYDVTSLTAAEWLSLGPWVDRKGGIVVVSPLKRQQPIRHYEQPLEFIVKEGNSIEAIVVAGVGSSVVGTAALARNVADGYDIDVAGIVSGYGMADVVVEALGGWYFYGKIDQLRFELQNGITNLNKYLSSIFARGGKVTDLIKNYEFPMDDFVPPSLDIRDLNEILLVRYVNATRPRLNIKLLLGHSKGNLLISSALNHISNELRSIVGDKTYARDDHSMQHLKVVTLGAVVDLPTKLIKAEHQYQFLGRLDVLGRANSPHLWWKHRICRNVDRRCRAPSQYEDSRILGRESSSKGARRRFARLHRRDERRRKRKGTHLSTH